MTLLLTVVRVCPRGVGGDTVNSLFFNISVASVRLVFPLSMQVLLFSLMGSCSGIFVADSFLVVEEVIRGRGDVLVGRSERLVVLSLPINELSVLLIQVLTRELMHI